MFKSEQKNFKRVLGILICIVLVTASLVYAAPQPVANAGATAHAKNVIMMIPDGTSVEAITTARWYNGGEPFAMDSIAVGLTRTYWSNGPITDSAPGSTAYSTGFKTYDKYVGVVNEEGNVKPKATILEAAKLSGKATGLVFTCEVMHATPADFSAHDLDRQNYNSIGKQQVYEGLDVVLGGGDEFLSPAAGGKRKDNQDLRDTLKGLGYEYITTKVEMDKSKASKLWGMFAPRDLMYDIDRQYTGSDQPTLAEMTKKALSVLSKDTDGFFLMVEGSKVDWAAHANDPAGVVSDIKSFSDAVKEAIDFAKKDGNTVVIVSPDHGTGGISIGSSARSDYSSVTFEETVNKLQNIKVTAEKFNSFLLNKSNEEVLAISSGEPFKITDITKAQEALLTNGYLTKNDDEIKALAKEYFGLTDLTEADLKNIKAGNVEKVVSARANIGWTTGGHVGGDVALFNYAPPGVAKLSGIVENTAVADYMEDVLNLDLASTTEKLFVNAEEGFKNVQAKIELDVSDMDNPKLIAKKGSNTLTLYGYTNKATFNGKDIVLKGETIFTLIKGVYNLKDVYVPQDAIKLLEK